MGTLKKPGRVKSAILNWMGIPISLADGTFWGSGQERVVVARQ